MAVYAYDIPPYLFVRLAPGVGADLALIGPLPEGADGQLLGDARLIGGLQQASYPQLLLDLSAAGELPGSTLHWLASSLVGALTASVQHLALVLPPSSAPYAEDLRALAAQHAPGMAFACFGEQGSAIRWMASRLPGVGATTTPEEVRSDAQAGRWAEAVARYRAMYAAPLSAAIEVVESLVAEAVVAVEAPGEGTSDGPAASQIPSTEQPAMGLVPSGPRVVPEPVPTGLASDLAPFGPTAFTPEEPVTGATEADAPVAPRASDQVSSPETDDRGSSPGSPTRASLAAQASQAQAVAGVRQARAFDDPQTTERSLDDALFASGESVAEAALLEARQGGGFDALLRGLLSKPWHVAFDGDRPRLDDLDGGLGVLALDDLPMDDGGVAPVTLTHDRLALLLDDECRQVRFSPGRDDEITLRHHQLAGARAALTSFLVEANLLALDGSIERLAACLEHPFQVLLERGEQGDRIALVPGPEGGLVALLFTAPDALLRLLGNRPAALTLRPLCALTGRGESLVERLMVLPIDGILVNAAGPAGPILLRRDLLASRPPASVARSTGGPEAATAAPAPDPGAVLPADPIAPRLVDAPAGPPPLPARSLAEAHFYLDQRGHDPQDRYQWTEQRPGITLWCFHSKGPDGQPHRVDFALPGAPPTAADGYFGPGTSPLLGPVELVTAAGTMARAAPGSPYGLRPEELSTATHRLEMATILVSEALRFYGPTDDHPPAASLRTDEERQALGQDPERFRRPRVEELARSYWLLATQLGEALRGTA